MLEDMTAVLQDNLNKGVWLQYGNKSPKDISKSDLQAVIKWEISAFNIKSVSDINLQQNFLQLYDRLQKSDNVNTYELDRKLMQVFDIKNASEILLSGSQKQILDLLLANKEFASLMLQAVDNPEILQSVMGLMKINPEVLMQLTKLLGSKPMQPGGLPEGGMPPMPMGGMSGMPNMAGPAMGNMVAPNATMPPEASQPIGEVGL